MPKQRNNTSSAMDNQSNKIVQKANEKSSENEPRNMEDYDLNNKNSRLQF